MINLIIGADKKLALSSGASFAGEKGTVASVALPGTIAGDALSGFDGGALYIKYGDAYAELEFDSLSGTQEVDIPDAALAEAGTITLWAELTGGSGDIVVKTSLMPYVVGAGETYVAPEAAGGGEE